MENKPSCAQKTTHDSGASSFDPKRTNFPKEDETEPLNFPHFSVILTKSHVDTAYHLKVPVRFHGDLPSNVTRVILTHHGKTWEMDCTGKGPASRRLSHGWKNFTSDNNLKMGDGCVFELVSQLDETAIFKVQILRGDIPKELLNKINSAGNSKDDPIIL